MEKNQTPKKEMVNTDVLPVENRQMEDKKDLEIHPEPDIDIDIKCWFDFPLGF